ncbi:hypothetical protein YT1_3959 [Rhodococcus ruber]|nr:hypothetical protein YT1_3959 [Rhodococcus ruber]
MFHGLPQAQVDRQGQRCEQLGTPRPGPRPRRRLAPALHGPIVLRCGSRGARRAKMRHRPHAFRTRRGARSEQAKRRRRTT